MMKFCMVLVAVLAVYLGHLVKNLVDTMTYDKQLEFSKSDSCRHIALASPVEDMSDYDGKSVIGGMGDLWNTFLHGSEKAKDGAMYRIHVDGRLEELSITGKTVPAKFVWHGIYYSKNSKRLYGVNHVEAQGEAVEVFNVIDEGIDNGEDGRVRLEHLQTITSPLFGNFALNDVVEGSGDEIYVSEWQPYGFPEGGKAGMSTAPLLVKMQRVLVTLLMLSRTATTRLLRCTLGEGSDCQVASGARFVGANGLAVSADRQTIYVVDPASTSISVMARQDDGQLERVLEFPTKHAVDNIEMHSEGFLTGGSIPLLYTCGVVCSDAKELSATKVVDGREVGCGKTPGGLLQIPLPRSGETPTVASQRDLGMHDGSKLPGISAGLLLSDKVLLGSPESPGVLICDA